MQTETYLQDSGLTTSKKRVTARYDKIDGWVVLDGVNGTPTHKIVMADGVNMLVPIG